MAFNAEQLTLIQEMLRAKKSRADIITALVEQWPDLDGIDTQDFYRRLTRAGYEIISDIAPIKAVEMVAA